MTESHPMNSEPTSNKLIVVSGPGGVGKGTVVAELLTLDPGLALSRSWTTREQRPSESVDAYTFVTVDEFKAAIRANAFLEFDHHFGNYYGSPVPKAGNVDDLILEIDVNGALQIYQNGHEALYVFIDTPSVSDQRERMLSRGDALDKVEERMLGGERERELASQLPYHHVINAEVSACAAKILELINEYRIAA